MRILIVAAIVAFTAIQQNVEPELFAPGIISTADDELNAAFTPDQRTVFFTKSTPSNRMGVIFVSQLRGNKWSSPEVASFSGRYSDYDPFVTVDGEHIYFISNRPKPDSATTKNFLRCARKTLISRSTSATRTGRLRLASGFVRLSL